MWATSTAEASAAIGNVPLSASVWAPSARPISSSGVWVWRSVRCVVSTKPPPAPQITMPRSAAPYWPVAPITTIPGPHVAAKATPSTTPGRRRLRWEATYNVLRSIEKPSAPNSSDAANAPTCI